MGSVDGGQSNALAQAKAGELRESGGQISAGGGKQGSEANAKPPLIRRPMEMLHSSKLMMRFGALPADSHSEGETKTYGLHKSLRERGEKVLQN
ncbi:MAG TPA: hypothetical protein IAC19_05360 [Candidatus Ventricola gallistercoris]|nr:hypothetical protein [Candidatus Ventricola gallistercoris]